jgi:hypothetical protein
MNQKLDTVDTGGTMSVIIIAMEMIGSVDI